MLIYPQKEINLESLKHNFNIIKASAFGTRVCVMVKADAYGHGLTQTALSLQSQADFFGVARNSEAIALRKAGIAVPILVVGAFEHENAISAVENDITLTIMDECDAESAIYASRMAKKTLKLHLKINTGMNRYGVTTKKQASNIARQIEKSGNCFLEGAYTHFSCAYSNPEYTYLQFAKFLKITDGLNIPIRHCSASDAIPIADYHLDMVRTGISVYGYGSAIKGLRPVMTIRAKIGKAYEYAKGEAIGYERAYRLKNRAKVAVVEIGYGDGLPRLKSKGFMIVNGVKCPIIGNVCMDLTMLDVSGAGCVHEGLTAEIISAQQNADLFASYADTISYDMLTCWTERVKKIYINS